jgi:uncharacterized protein (TIGR02147 family)
VNLLKLSRGDQLEKQTSRPDIFLFDNYQKYLREMYLYKKSIKPTFSHGFMASQLKTSVSYMKHVFEGRRNIGIDRISAIARLFSLQEKELNYFTILVIRDVVNDGEIKNYLSDTLDRLKFLLSKIEGPFGNERVVHAETVLGHWLSSAIYEMVSCDGFRSDGDWIRDRLVDGDKISKQEVEDILARLLKDGALKKNGEGLEPAGQIVGSPNPFASQGFSMYQAIVGKTHQVLNEPARYKPCRFFVGSFAVNKEGEEKILEQFRVFGESVTSIAQSCANKDRILILSNNLFTASKK